MRARAIGTRVGALVAWLSRLCFLLSCTALVVILVITIYEVSMRYFLDSPTMWVSDAVRYLLAFMIMLGLPEVTRRDEHVSISLVLDALRPGHPLRRVLFVISALVCGFVTWLAADVALTQLARDLHTQGTWRIPRVWVTGAVVAGFAMAAATFLTLALKPAAED